MALVLGYNLLTFGNGPVMVPLLQRHIVEERGILSLDQFLYAYALGRVTPGQANLYVAAIGYMTFGWSGALATVAAIQVPGYLVLPLVKGYRALPRGARGARLHPRPHRGVGEPDAVGDLEYRPRHADRPITLLGLRSPSGSSRWRTGTR